MTDYQGFIRNKENSKWQQILLIHPLQKKIPFTYTHSGITISDEYKWLETRNEPDVVPYLEAENKYAHDMLFELEDLRNTLFREMKGRIVDDDRSAPEKRGEYVYFHKVSAGEQYRRFYRFGSDAPEKPVLLIDENKLAEGNSYCKVAIFEPSPDNRLLAFGVDTTGSWTFDLYVLDMETLKVVYGPIGHCAYSVAWGDEYTLFYSEFDAAHRPYKIFRLRVEENSSKPEMVYFEADESFTAYISRSRSGKYLILTISSHSSSEVRILPASTPNGEFQLVQPRLPWIEYYLEHQNERFYIRTNEKAANFRLLETMEAHPQKENWREVIAHRPDVFLEDVFAFEKYVVVQERKDGLVQVRISSAQNIASSHLVNFPEPAYMVDILTNPEYQTDFLRFSYSSMITPETIVDYEFATSAWKVLKKQEIPAGYEPSDYITERKFAPTIDGVMVPMSIVYKKGIRMDSSAPLLLYGYGAYGFSQNPSFGAQRLSLLDRGFIFVIGHIRGGSELGRSWYEQGRLMHKMNSFTDFIACADYLVNENYTRPERLAIMGGSAGGLLVSACANLRPELFKVVIARVPFTNVISAILNPDLPLTIIEYDQWGHPDDPEAFAYMHSYSPYEQIEAKNYPYIYARAGLNDLQVPYWDPAKWVARLRATKTDSRPIYLITNMGAGHSGASGRYDSLGELAEIYAYLIAYIER